MQPDKIGRYEIKSELGRGGMAVVYRGFDPQTRREVAIKVLPPQFLADSDFRSRFEREAHTIASLEHPAIVPLYDFGEDTQGGHLYFVMRLMPGGSLADRVRKGPIPLAEIARIFSRIAPGLDEAHSKGIIHRDLKPGNILFDHRNDPYISDFGIAKRLGAEGTATGSIMGTPAYMSPEQARGHRDITGQSDIYALGAILFEAFTGRPPFDAETPVGIALKHITEPVPQLRNFNTALPAACQTVLDTAMAKSPTDRFANAVEFASALNAVARGEPITMRRIKPDQPPTIRPTPPPKEQPHAEPTPAAKGTRRRASPWGCVLVGGGLLVVGLLAAVLAGVHVYNNPEILASFLTTNTPDLTAPALATDIAATHVGETEVASTEEAVARATIESQTTVDASTRETQNAVINTTNTAIVLAQSTIDAATVATANAAATAESVAVATAQAQATTDALLTATKIAFFKEDDVWIVGVDGAGLDQLTTDGGKKSNLRWLPDGQTLAYISGRCVQTVHFLTKATGSLGCFNSSELIEGFEVSPDGQLFAYSINRITYIGDYNPEALAGIQFYSPLQQISNCMVFSRSATKYLRWSADSAKLAIMVIGVTTSGEALDTIQLIDLQCGDNNPRSLDQFPGTRFEWPKETIQNFGWDGNDLFALVDSERNEGFGSIFIYNTSNKKRPAEVNPLNSCCYRDLQWSPDGSHVVFVYQDKSVAPENKIELYYVPYGTLGTGARYEPIPLPDGFFTDPREKPQPVISPQP